MPIPCDILIVGGGPAGATVAALLADAGRDVILCEGKRFPRPKVCGEFMSAQCRPVLARLGLVAWYDAHAGPAIRHVLALPADGPELLSDLPPAADGSPARTMRRDILDAALLDRAAALGARIIQPAHVAHVGHTPSGLLAQTSAGEIHANAVVLAHGMARRGDLSPGLPRPPQADGYLCFKTHVAGATLDLHTIAIGGAAGLYAGLVHTSGQPVQSTLAFVISRDRLARFGHDADVHVRALCRTNRGFARMLATARVASPWLASGPLSPGVRTLYTPRRFFVGNAAGEVHALIGEGITLAMRGGMLLADTIRTHGTGDRAGRIYGKAWRNEFSLRYHAANLFAAIATRPALSVPIAALLDRKPELLRACVVSSGKW